MKRMVSRRRALAVTGTAAAGMALGRGRATEAAINTQNEIGRSEFWEPGPDKNLKKDLKPGKTPILLSATLKRPQAGSIHDMVKRVRETGHTSAFLYPSYWGGKLSEQDIRELRDALKTFGIKIFEFGGYENMLHPDTATRERYWKNLSGCIEMAEKFDCPMVGTISGTRDRHPYGINPHPDNWTLPTWRLLVAGVKQVLKDTSGSKVVLGMEAQVTTNLDGPRAHLRLMEDVGDDRCVVNLDPVNMVSFERYFHTTELIEECFDLLGEKIYGCHAKDSYIWPERQTVQVQEVCPGRGVLDYETYLVRMSRLKWPRSIHPEHIPDDQYPEADAYIRKVAQKVGVTIAI
jgi:sugar phosphate isomerase/epimerase